MTGQRPRIVRIQADPATAGKRLDRVLATHLADLSRSHLQRLVRAGKVRAAGGTLVDPSARIKPGEVLIIELPEPEPAEPAPEPIPLAIPYEDEHLLVVDKPAGLVVHPAAGHTSGTLVNALIAHCGDSLAGIGGVKRPGIVHRLDKDTSGLLVVAKTDLAYRGLQKQFASHGADGALARIYVAIVWGEMGISRGRIDAPLARSTANRTKISVVHPPAGRIAVTHYEVAARYRNAGGRAIASRLDVRLETGRTHQIRVHLAHVGHPLLGDRTYGAGHAASAGLLGPQARAALEALGRQALHARHLGLLHPVTGRRFTFDSPLPVDLARLEQALVAAE